MLFISVENTTDAATEKHVPVYEKVEDEIVVKVGEVEHPMEKEHYIMWIAQVTENRVNKVKLYPYKTRVILSNGQGAVVEESRVGQYDSYKPVVYTRPYPGKKIDLRESTNITIKSVLSKSKFKNLMKDQIEDMKNIASSSDSGR